MLWVSEGVVTLPVPWLKILQSSWSRREAGQDPSPFLSGLWVPPPFCLYLKAFIIILSTHSLISKPNMFLSGIWTMTTSVTPTRLSPWSKSGLTQQAPSLLLCPYSPPVPIITPDSCPHSSQRDPWKTQSDYITLFSSTFQIISNLNPNGHDLTPFPVP